MRMMSSPYIRIRRLTCSRDPHETGRAQRLHEGRRLDVTDRSYVLLLPLLDSYNYYYNCYYYIYYYSYYYYYYYYDYDYDDDDDDDEAHCYIL